MRLYNELNEIIRNDLINYNKRPSLKNIVSKSRLECISRYTTVWGCDESLKNEALHISQRLDKKLYNHISMVTSYGVGVTIHEPFIAILDRLVAIDEALTYEECDNLSLGKRARQLRREWRATLREAHKHLDICHKNHLNWVKEHRKPRRTYELGATGECHNGLYWTLRELVLHPSYIKYGFRRIGK